MPEIARAKLRLTACGKSGDHWPGAFCCCCCCFCCAQAWVADGMVRLNGVSIPRWVVDEAKIAKGTQTFEFTFGKHQNVASPPCTSQLEGHMALERDEWFRTDGGQMSGLFMPFANMHVQLLSMLADHPFEDKMNWPASLKTSAAEYGD